MNRHVFLFACVAIFGSGFLVACKDEGIDVSKGEAIPEMLEAADEIIIKKGQVRLERIPTMQTSQKNRVLKWRLIPGDDNLVLSCGMTGSKGHGSLSMSGTSLGPALSSGLLITFDEKTVDGESVLSMVELLGSKDAKKKLMEVEPNLEKSELIWYDLQMYSNTKEGESTTSTSGVVPGSARVSVEALYNRSEKDGINYFSVGQRFILARSTSIPLGSSFSHGVSNDPLTLMIDGKSIPIEEYEYPAWVLWVEVNLKK
ncbi:MAG: hypothetical protein ACI97A_004391 [Planctomycetota bacterium]|jgi:hypothetical protein